MLSLLCGSSSALRLSGTKVWVVLVKLLCECDSGWPWDLMAAGHSLIHQSEFILVNLFVQVSVNKKPEVLIFHCSGSQQSLEFSDQKCSFSCGGSLQMTVLI